MTPAELDLTHHIKNIIGVNPSYYEFLLSIDADTTVDEHALSKMIARMMRDRRVIGLCGETSLANPKRTIISMLQVYEYWISHHMIKVMTFSSPRAKGADVSFIGIRESIRFSNLLARLFFLVPDQNNRAKAIAMQYRHH